MLRLFDGTLTFPKNAPSREQGSVRNAITARLPGNEGVRDAGFISRETIRIGIRYSPAEKSPIKRDLPLFVLDETNPQTKNDRYNAVKATKGTQLAGSSREYPTRLPKRIRVKAARKATAADRIALIKSCVNGDAFSIAFALRLLA